MASSKKARESGSGTKVDTEIRYSPVAPNVLPTANSHIPASNWTRPPTKIAMPTTTLGVATPRAWTLMRERMKVVEAKEKRPLENEGFLSDHEDKGRDRRTHRGPGLPRRRRETGEWLFSRSI
jgi:hypothetical protein